MSNISPEERLFTGPEASRLGAQVKSIALESGTFGTINITGNATINLLNGSSISSGIVSPDATQILTNKSMEDSSTYIINATDDTKRLKFDLNNQSTETTTTIRLNNTSNITYDIPNSSTNTAVVLTTENQTISGTKTFNNTIFTDGVSAVSNDANLTLSGNGTGGVSVNGTLKTGSIEPPDGSTAVNVNIRNGSLSMSRQPDGAVYTMTNGSLTIDNITADGTISSNTTLNLAGTTAIDMNTPVVTTNTITARTPDTDLTLAGTGTGSVFVDDDLKLSGAITTSVTNGNIELIPDGAGNVIIGGLTKLVQAKTLYNNSNFIQLSDTALGGMTFNGGDCTFNTNIITTGTISANSGSLVISGASTNGVTVKNRLQTNNITTETNNTDLALTAQGTGTVTCDKQFKVDSITTNTNTQLTLTGQNGLVQIADLIFQNRILTNKYTGLLTSNATQSLNSSSDTAVLWNTNVQLTLATMHSTSSNTSRIVNTTGVTATFIVTGHIRLGWEPTNSSPATVFAIKNGVNDENNLRWGFYQVSDCHDRYMQFNFQMVLDNNEYFEVMVRQATGSAQSIGSTTTNMQNLLQFTAF